MCQNTAKPPVIYGDGQQTRDFTFVKDVVKGTINFLIVVMVVNNMDESDEQFDPEKYYSSNPCRVILRPGYPARARIKVLSVEVFARKNAEFDGQD